MQEDEEDEEEEIRWLDDIDDEEIDWQDDTDSGTRGVVNSKNKNRHHVEDEVEVHPWKKRWLWNLHLVRRILIYWSL